MADPRVNILGEETGEVSDLDGQLLCLRALRRAADSGDARAASWWLEHHPSTSGVFSDAAVSGRIEKEVAAKFYRAVIAYAMPLHEERRFLLFMQQEGLPIADAEDDVKLRETIEERIIARLAENRDDAELREKIERSIVARIVDVIKRPGMPQDVIDRVIQRLRSARIITAEQAEV